MCIVSPIQILVQSDFLVFRAPSASIWDRWQFWRSIAYSNGCHLLALICYAYNNWYSYCISWLLRAGWMFVLGLYKGTYLSIFECRSFWWLDFCSLWEDWDPVNRFNHTNCMSVVTPTDCPKSVRNGCRIEIFDALSIGAASQQRTLTSHDTWSYPIWHSYLF